MQKTLKIQSFTGGFLVYANSNGKPEKLIKPSLEETLNFAREFLIELPKEDSSQEKT